MAAEEKKSSQALSKTPKSVASKREQSSTAVEDEGPHVERKKETLSSYDFEADWERVYVANIESAKTVPYINEIAKENEVKKPESTRIYTRYLNLIFRDNNIKTRRRKKIEDIFSVDDGPSVCDYNFELGLEFWSRYSNIEKNTLQQSVPSGFWDKKEDSYRDLKAKLAKMHVKRGFLKSIWNSFDSPIVFLRGYYEPIRAPQRVISPEEKFRVVSVAQLKKASADVIPPHEYRTLTEVFERQILALYKYIVDLWGGKWPRIRKPTLEEVYDDVLIWILDVEQSKERILAILNDRIKKEII